MKVVSFTITNASSKQVFVKLPSGSFSALDVNSKSSPFNAGPYAICSTSTSGDDDDSTKHLFISLDYTGKLSVNSAPAGVVGELIIESILDYQWPHNSSSLPSSSLPSSSAFPTSSVA